MKPNVNLNHKNKPAKSSAKNVTNPGKLPPMENKAPNDTSANKEKSVTNTVVDIESLNSDLNDATDEYLGDELYTLRYDTNERGIGKILLPPSLSTLLQSDRVCISPTAGGLFIKSL